MKWFKHYATAQQSELLAEILEEMGNEGYGIYWRILELLCSNYDGESVIFSFRTSTLKRQLGIKGNNKLKVICGLLDNNLVISAKLSEKSVIFEAPILSKLQDRDFKKSRKNRARIDKNRIDKNRIDILSDEPPISHAEIITYLNNATGKKFSSIAKATQRVIKARFRDGYSLEDFKKVIDNKVQQWGDDSKMSEYLRPQTLFGTNFESYLNHTPQKKFDIDSLELE